MLKQKLKAIAMVTGLIFGVHLAFSIFPRAHFLHITLHWISRLILLTLPTCSTTAGVLGGMRYSLDERSLGCDRYCGNQSRLMSYFHSDVYWIFIVTETFPRFSIQRRQEWGRHPDDLLLCVQHNGFRRRISAIYWSTALNINQNRK